MLRRLVVVSSYFFVAGLTLVVASPAQAALRYRLMLLSHPPDYEFTTASSISEDGRIGGTATGFGAAAVYWASADAPVERIIGVGADCSTVLGVNSSGVAVGMSMEGFFAYRWQSGSDLETLLHTTICCPRAEGINDSGAIVGRMPFDLSTSSDFAALWIGDTVQNLGAAPGHATSIALDISNAGHIVGRSHHNAARWIDNQAELLTGLKAISPSPMASTIEAKSPARCPPTA